MTPKRIAERLAKDTPPTVAPISLPRAISDVLVSDGLSQFEATEAAERLVPDTAEILGSLDPARLPFDVLEGRRLVGKARARPGDSRETGAIRRRLALVDEMRTAAFEIGPVLFEHLVAALLIENGADYAQVTARSHEGGVDVYGRMPLRLADPTIPTGLISSVLVAKALFFLAQAKCYDPSKGIGRDEVDRFAAQSASCINKYDGNPNPPVRRVPADAYVKGEATLKLLATTAGFTDGAIGAALGYDIQLIDGRAIAEHLIYRGRGVMEVSGEFSISRPALESWVKQEGGFTRGQLET